MIDTVKSGKLGSYLIGTSIGAGAVPAHFIALGLELQRRGGQVTIVTDTRKKKINPEIMPGTIYEWPSRRPVNFRDARFLLSVITKELPRCSIANFGAVNLFTLLHWVKRVPVRIVWYHTLDSQLDMDSPLPRWKTRLLRFRKSIVYSMATHVFANSHASAEEAHRIYKVPKSKCSVQALSLADPTGNLEWNGPAVQSCKITCVGRFVPSKGQDILVRALARLKPGLKWEAVLLGDGPNKPAVEKLAAELGIAGRCRFLGNIAHRAVMEEMAGAAVNVVPSFAEAYGFVAVESLALGLPVIASRTGGLAETIRDSVDGFLVPPGDAGALAAKLEILLTDPQLRKRMGTSGRERFLREFECSRVIREQADVIERIELGHVALRPQPQAVV